MRRNKTIVGLVTVAATAGLVLVGCGGSGKTAEVIKLSEYKMSLSQTTLKSGKTVFEGENVGGTTHEIVLVAGDDAKALPVADDGSIDEDKIEESAKLGEVGELEVGTKLKHTYDLKPGKYVVFCNLVSQEAGADVSHFAKGMFEVISVS